MENKRFDANEDATLENLNAENSIPNETPKDEADRPPVTYGVSFSPGNQGYDCRQYGEYFEDRPQDNAPKKPRNRGSKKPVLIVATVLVSLLVAVAMISIGLFTLHTISDMRRPESGSVDGPKGDQTSTPPESTEPSTVPDIPIGGGTAVIYKNTEGYDYSNSRTEMIEAIRQSVVEIRTEKTVSSIYYGNYTQSGAGSGVILMAEESTPGLYYIATNNHVIEGADQITVTLTDGESYGAVLVGTDSFSDVALIAVSVGEDKELKVASCGDSDKLLVGQEIYAIGNPLGTLGGSVSRGIISCTERKITVDGMAMTLLQIDAAVNPGNSGGALFDEFGNLVGIVNAKYSDEGIEGLGFAIPVNRAVEIVNELYVHGYVTDRATLDLKLINKSYNIDGATSARPTVSADSNVVCTYTDEDGKEQSFKLSSGDLIDSVNGTTVTSANYLLSLLSEYEVGDTVELTVYKYEKTGTATDWFGQEKDTYEYVKYTVNTVLTEDKPD